ncbi:MAG TPA: hypothetical protein VIL48_18840 [Acidimicrobiales bacterium]
MLVACWSVKGGSGATVVAASLALLVAERAPGGALFADLAGDGPAVLGLPEPSSPGLAGWLASGADVPADALSRIEVRATPRLGLLPRGEGPLDPARAGVLAALLDAGSRPVVVDAGAEPGQAAQAVIAAAHRSILVIRPCYLALRRALDPPLSPTEVVLVREPGRSLGRADVARVVDAPIVAEVELDPAVARAVDAGLLASRLPRSFARRLQRATP